MPIKQDILRVQVTLADIDGNPVHGEAATLTVDLQAVHRSADVDSRGASEFSAFAETLQGVCQFIGTVEKIDVDGNEVRDIPFRYPAARGPAIAAKGSPTP